MKKRIFFLLFFGTTFLSISQHNNKNLKPFFGEGAFEINIPNTWVKISPTYPYYWLNEYRYKDSMFNSYFKIGQYKIIKSKKPILNKVAKHRVKELRKGGYRKFNYKIKAKSNNHLILKTSWQNWRNKKLLVKHTTEFVKVGEELYVFRYSDSTITSINFKEEVKKAISSFNRINEFKKDPYIRIFIKPKFSVKFLSDWIETEVKSNNRLNTIVFFKKEKHRGSVNYIDSPVFIVEPDYFILKQDVSLRQLELIIFEMDKSLRNNEKLKSRITEKFIEFTGIWKDYKKSKRKKTIRYFKHNNSVIKVTYDARVEEYNYFLKEKKLFFGGLKFNK